MNIRTSIFQLVIAAIFSALSLKTAFASDVTVGVGLGSQYSGLGFNTGLLKNENLFLLSFGSAAVGATREAGIASVYGFGATWLSTNIVSHENNRHALGIYAGILGGQIEFRFNEVVNKHSFYGGGITYVYFFNGLGSSGWNLSLFLGTYNQENNWRVGGAPGIGYQSHF